MKDIDKFLLDEINKLNKLVADLASMDVINCNSITMKKQMQGKLNKAYGTIVDVKMSLEKIVNELEEENDSM